MNKFLIVLSLLFANLAFSADLNWAGLYRLEGTLIRNPTLVGGNQVQTDYLVHHLVLRPQIIAADGITVRSRFDLFNNSNKFSQAGQLFGSNFTSNGDTNTAATGTMNSETLQVNELYLTWVQGFGSFVAGRIPIHFGLGITHNAGNEVFDHWYSVKDIVGYKVIMGNFSVMPMVGKIREDNITLDDDVNEILLQGLYENSDSDLTLGILYQDRNAPRIGADLSLTTNPYYTVAGVSANDQFSVKDINFFVKKKVGVLGISFEAGYQSGSTGLKTAANEGVSVEGFAFMAELNYALADSNWAWNLKLGSVSGNDPNTTKYEGYLVNRNYHVAMLLFNYSLGQGDILGTNSFKSLTNQTSADAEYLSNALYFTPGFNWKWGEKWGMDGAFTYALLNKTQYSNQGKNLGYELDLGIAYKPHEHLTWKTTFGILMPGDAFKGGANNYETSTVYGLTSKIAVSF